MIKLHDRNATQEVEHHLKIPVREYENDTDQKYRIAAARENAGAVLSYGTVRVVDLGCGTGDVGGYLSNKGAPIHVIGFEVNPDVAARARERWPLMEVRVEDLHTVEPIPCQLLIMTEILEHYDNPIDLVGKWMPKAEYAVYSSPENGDIEQDYSANEHMWSLAEEDFIKFAKAGGHDIISSKIVPCGIYSCRMMVTKNRII